MPSLLCYKMVVLITRCVLVCVMMGSTLALELDEFYHHQVVPDVIAEPPDAFLSVYFPLSGVAAEAGKEVLVSQVHEVPQITWDAQPELFYTLCMTDPDAPSRDDRSEGEYRHWLVVNIPGGSVDEGQALTEFLPSGPPPGSGLHRYTFLVYQQSAWINFHDSWSQTDDPRDRAFFSIAAFAAEHEMRGPVAGNFYTSAQQSPSEDASFLPL